MSEDTALAAFTPSTTTVAPTPTGPAPVPQKLSENVTVTGFGDPTVRQWDFDLYSGVTGVTDRIYIVRADRVVKGRTHYHDKLRAGVQCFSKYEIQGNQQVMVSEAACCRLLGPSQLRFAVLVVKYGTMPNGDVITKPFSYDLRLWKFGKDKYSQLTEIYKSFPLDKHDLSVKCTDKEYQKLTIGAKPDCIIMDPKFPASVRDGIFQWADTSLSKLSREMGRVFASEAELVQELQKAGVVVGGAVPGSAPAPQMVQPSDAPIMGASAFEDIVGQLVPDAAAPSSGQ